MLLFNNPSFLRYVNVTIYGSKGIARKESINFTRDMFPISPLCMAAATVSPPFFGTCVVAYQC